MLFGLTHAEKEERESPDRAKEERLVMGVRRFAFFPTQMRDGRYRWLWFYWHSHHAMMSHRGKVVFRTILPSSNYPHNRFWEYDHLTIGVRVYLKEKYAESV